MRKGKKISGGKYIKSRKKRFYEILGQKIVIRLGEEKGKSKRICGGRKKNFLLRAKFVNVIIKSSKGKTKAKKFSGNEKFSREKNKKVEIKNVFETPSNRFLARQNVITKGTIVETELGKVKITNRPSQEGMVNGVLME